MVLAEATVVEPDMVSTIFGFTGCVCWTRESEETMALYGDGNVWVIQVNDEEWRSTRTHL